MDLSATQIEWLQGMHRLLQWKVIFPQAENPYGKSLSSEVLKELASNRETLLKKVGLRCLLDGDEIIIIRSLHKFTLETDHPKLTHLKKRTCQDYMKKCGVVTFIESELDKIQRSYKEALENRDKEKRKRNLRAPTNP